MKKVVLWGSVLSLLVGGSAWAAKPAAKSVTPAKSAAAPVVQSASKAAAVEQNVETMKPGLTYSFDLDFKLFNISNPTFANSNGSSSWYFYPTYRAVLSNVFQNGFAVLADVEKPGYAGITYPTVKINELYAKYKEGSFYVKLGRQVIGDTSDLLLGLQNDAILAGFDLGEIDLRAFFAKTELLLPWDGGLVPAGPTMDGLIGFIPTFGFGPTMGLNAYLLIGTEPITVTSGTPPTTSDKVNALITVGGKYYANLPVSEDGKLDLAGQLGLQFAMAQDNTAQTINATNLGMKIDGGFSNLPRDGVGFKVNAHVVYTGGTDTTATNPNYPFVSPNALIGSGPGLFSKIENGAGPYTYLDALNGNSKVQQYAGVFAFGVSGDILVGDFDGGLGFWTYMDTNHYNPAPSTSSLGSELNQIASYKLLSSLSIYEQMALFFPSNPANVSPAPGSALKFLVGSTLSF